MSLLAVRLVTQFGAGEKFAIAVWPAQVLLAPPGFLVVRHVLVRAVVIQDVLFLAGLVL